MERAQTAPATTGGFTPRRGVQLPPIQTTFQKPPQRLQRPRPVEQVIVARECQSMPPSGRAPLGRRTSKGGIFGLFGRNKSQRSMKPPVTSSIVENGDEREKTKRIIAADEVVSEPEKADSAVERSLSINKNHTIPAVARTSTSTNKQRPAKGAVRSKSFKKESTTWDPPPLFQAYPQAVKHSSLSAPSMSADAILRHSRTQKKHGADTSNMSPAGDEYDCDHQNTEKRSRSANKRQKSHDAIFNGSWVQKIYVLVTSGYMLQYAGDGTFDRLPERIMALGKDSAAFASDVIPGKPWVLHVCQEASDDENSLASQGQNFVFKNFPFRNETRRPASNFLLVIDSPEEMNEWLVAVRKEIEALGGKQYNPDVLCRRTSSEVRRTLREKPSRRFLIKRDPNQFAGRAWDPMPDPKSPSDAVPPEPAPKDSDRRPSLNARRSVDSPSVCNTTVSIEQGNLDRLRETPRMSYSSNAKTLSTSPASSPNQSPVHARFHFVENVNIEPSIDRTTPKAQPTSTHNSSRPPVTQRTSSDASNPRPTSSYFKAGPSEITSPPHFSVPSYSKRYSVANNRISRIASPPTIRSSTIEESDAPSSQDNGDSQDNRRTSTLGELQPTSRTSPKGSKSLGNLSAYFKHPPPPTIAFAPHTSPGELISPKADSKLPKRFSSLEYSRGISPVRDGSSEVASPSPHPPPTTALPAIPGTSSTLHPPGSHRHSIQPFSKPSKQAYNLRRPISMQVRTRSTVKVHEDTFDIVSKAPFHASTSTTSSASTFMPECLSLNGISSSVPTPAPPTRSAPPPPQQPQIETAGSLPHINCVSQEGMTQLPRLPSIRVSQKGFRGSLEGPWSAGYSSERSHSVRAS